MYKFYIQPHEVSGQMVPHGVTIPAGALIGRYEHRIDWYCLDLRKNSRDCIKIFVYDYRTGSYKSQWRKDALAKYILDHAEIHGFADKLNCTYPDPKTDGQRAAEKRTRQKVREHHATINSCFGRNPNRGKMETKHCKALVNANKRWAARGNSTLITYSALTFKD
jgi:hypothetical protein